MEDGGLILGVVHEKLLRGCPAFILNHLEVVSNMLNIEPGAITFCSLCGFGVVRCSMQCG